MLVRSMAGEHWAVRWIVGVSTMVALRLKSRAAVEEDARAIFEEHVADLAAGFPDIVRATPEAFPGTDTSYHDEMRDRLAALGFAFVDDFSNRSMSDPRRFVHPYFTRGMTRAEDGCFASFWEAGYKTGLTRELGPENVICRVMSFSTAFSDGTREADTDERALARVTMPGVVVRFHPADSPVESLLKSHERAVARRLSAEPRLRTIPVKSFGDLVERHRDATRRGIEHQWSDSYSFQKQLVSSSEWYAKGNARRVGREIDRLWREWKTNHPKPVC